MKALGKGSTYQIVYEDTKKAGIYTLELSIPSQVIEEREGIETKEYFAVNVDSEEGDIHYLSKEELLKNFKNLDIQYERDVETKASSLAGKQDVEYWRQILLFLFLLTLGETFLAMWFGKYNT